MYDSQSPDSLNYSISPSINLKICEVCQKTGHGQHFGAFTCRACATFFRRYGFSSRVPKPCEKGENCDFMKNGYFRCKKCRLKKCVEVGMRGDGLRLAKVSSRTKIPSTMDTFLGRSNLIIFCAPNPELAHSKKFINVRCLIKQAEIVLTAGLETPILAENSLEKMAFGLNRSRGSENIGPLQRLKFITKVGRDEVMMFWQSDMLKVTKWLTHFDEFQQLPFQIRIQIIKGIWRVWSRLDRLISTMIGRRNNTCGDKSMMMSLKDTSIVFDLKYTKVDISWQSNYNVEQLKLFGYSYLDEKSEQLIQELMSLELTDVELAYMMCQLCFYYVGKRFQGVILEVSERLLEILSNHLHEYYTREKVCQKYSVRIASMMRINNQIQNGITKRRAKVELMKIFDVFFVEFSDPEMFVDA